MNSQAIELCETATAAVNAARETRTEQHLNVAMLDEHTDIVLAELDLTTN